MESKLRVLMIEDVKVDAELAFLNMRRAGIDCFTRRVATEAELIQELDHFCPDVILSDFSLPGFHGFAALEIAQRMSPDIPFLFVSGTIGEERAIESLKRGATDYVIKTNLARLPAAVNRALKEVRERDARREAEQKLHASETKFRLIAENVSDLISMVDTQGVRVYANPAYEALMGDSESLVGTDCFHHIHPDDRMIVRQLFDGTAATGEGKRAEFRLLLADGRTRYIESRGDVVRDGCEKVSNVVIVSRDVTERKLAEEHLSAALKEKETLLKEVYHRVKNNLQIISALLSLQSNGLPEGAARTLLQDSADRVIAMALVHERLYQAKNLSEIDLPEYVESLVGHLLRSHGAQAKGISVKTEVASASVGIETSIPLALILSELITNCIKHAFPDQRPGNISIALEWCDGERLVMSVADDGVGLPQDFDLRSTRSLGLNLVRKLAAQIKGEVASESTARGTRFVVTFPVRKREQASQADGI